MRRLLLSMLVFVVVGAGLTPGHASAWSRSVCGRTRPKMMRCFAELAPEPQMRAAARRPYGLSPVQIKTAYGFPASLNAGQGKTIAVVTAYNSAHVEADLSVFSKEYAL